MKKILFGALFLSLFACKTPREAGHSSTLTEKISITLLQPRDNTWTIRVHPDSRLVLGGDSPHTLVLGELQAPSHLRAGLRSLMMTTISMQMAVAPESGYLNLHGEQAGKWAIVKGYLSGDLYEASVVCTFDEVPDPKLLRDFESGQKNIEDYCH